MSDHAKAFAAGRERLVGFLADLDESQWATRTTGCPEWDVHGVVSHLVGTGADMTSGRFPSGDIDAWIREAVEARKSTTPAELLAEWEQVAPALDALLENMPAMVGELLVGDLATHEQDIRSALGLVGGREGPAYELAFQTYANALGGRIGGAGLPALRLRGDSAERVAGEGEPGASVSASTFELLRALTGRRTPEQIAAFSWEGDPSPYLPIFSNYGMPEQPIVE